MSKLRISDVPFYLRDGSFFHSLDPNDKDVFEVPEKNLKTDTVVESSEDLKYLLTTVRFWGLKDVPNEAIQYIISQGGEASDSEEFVVEYPELGKLILLKEAPIPNMISEAIKLKLGIRVIRVLHQMKYPFEVEAAQAAATVGDLEILMYLHAEGCPWDNQIPAAAVNNGHLECLRYALEHDCPVHEGLLSVAAFAANVEVLECLYTHGLRWNELTMMAALGARKVDNVRFLVEAGCAIPHFACITAAVMGDLDSLTFLHESGGVLNLPCAVAAAAGGHLNCLTYLHAQGCPWNECCCEKAAFGGHLDCLKFLHENGCSWHYKTTSAAVAGGSWTCLWYALRHGAAFMHLVLATGSLVMLIYWICIAIWRDRSQNVCLSSYAYDGLLMLVLLCNLNTTLLSNFHGHYTQYVSNKVRKWYTIGFLVTVVVCLVYGVYSIYSCTDEPL